MVKKFRALKALLSVLCVAAVVLTGAGCNKVKYNESEITSEIFVPGEDGESGSGSSGETTGGESTASGGKNNASGTSSGKGGKTASGGKNTTVTDKDLKGSTVKILVWYDVPKSEQSVIDAFTKKTGIKVKFTKVAQKNYMTTLASRVGSGASPDLACIIGDTFPTPIVRGLMQELDSKYFDVNSSIYAKDVMDAYKWNGKYYAVAVKGSMMGDMYCVYYNKSMFDEMGVETPYEIWKKSPNSWTWSKFLEISEKMTRKTAAGQIYGVSIAYPQAVMLSAGTDLIKLSDKGFTNNMSDQKVKTAWKWINKLKASGAMMTANAYLTDLTQGKVAMHVNGQWLMQKGSAYATGMKDSWGVAPFPKQDNGEYYVPFRGTMWGVPKNASNVAGAAACVNYWLDPANSVSEVYANKECEEVHNWLWKQKKSILMSEGVINFKTAGLSTKIYSELMAGENAVDTTLASYTATVNGCIEYAMDSRN